MKKHRIDRESERMSEVGLVESKQERANAEEIESESERVVGGRREVVREK